ncbi:NUAK family SNF1-like kinase 1 [Danio aesculapii]|uniref:NUAK family SNF1-like kinase 1 n=1 Tax=Danio aesculapii TaxID=1142201 RepID=UPI0024C0CD89|nr:NUAK family SNF1-like kinase 1 [Danio aesculapii]
MELQQFSAPAHSAEDQTSSRVKKHLHKHSLKRRFEVLETLGRGTYGKVKRAVERQYGKTVAIKSIRKERLRNDLDRAHIQREIEITSSLVHPNIIRLYEVFESRERIVMVMEYASGGELYEHIQDKQRLSEDEARHFFRQITSAVHYCHQNGVVHRDLKLENILLDKDLNVKLADFGLSNRYMRGQCLDTFCGSPLYASPEIINGLPYHGPEVDCWSLGVLLYALVYGSMPFDGTSYSILKEQIRHGQYKTPNILSGACSLIEWMLTVKVENRATVENIANHWWLNLNCPRLPDTAFSRFTESKPCASTLTRKKPKDRAFTTNSNSVLLSAIESSTHNQPMKHPKKGILKKCYTQVEYADRSGFTGTSEDMDRMGTDNSRRRRGILKCNGKFSGVSPNTLASTWSYGFSKPNYDCDGSEQQEMEFEIKICLRKIHESTGLEFPQNRYFDKVC